MFLFSARLALSKQQPPATRRDGDRFWGDNIDYTQWHISAHRDDILMMCYKKTWYTLNGWLV